MIGESRCQTFRLFLSQTDHQMAWRFTGLWGLIHVRRGAFEGDAQLFQQHAAVG